MPFDGIIRRVIGSAGCKPGRRLSSYRADEALRQPDLLDSIHAQKAEHHASNGKHLAQEAGMEWA